MRDLQRAATLEAFEMVLSTLLLALGPNERAAMLRRLWEKFSMGPPPPASTA